MPNLLSLKCSLSLSFPTAAALKQNVTEKDGLEWNDRRDGYDKPTILLPDRWLTKEHDTARWQSRFTDAPSSQFPAVIRWRAEQYRRRIERAWDRPDATLDDGRPYLLGDAMTTADLFATMLMRRGSVFLGSHE